MCTILAGKYNCVVAATGEKDIVSYGKRIAVIIENEVEMLTKVTGAGCMLGALCGGNIGAEEDKFFRKIILLIEEEF